MKNILTYFTLFFGFFLSVSHAKDLLKTNRESITAVETLLTTLDEAQQKQMFFSFDNNDQRKRWSNLPTGIFERKGLRMGDLNKEQKEAIFKILQITLSKRGFQQVIDNMDSDELLKTTSSSHRKLIFGEDEYYFSILGIPSLTSPWMWQFGGHHLAVNSTFFEEHITLSPTMTGGQPIYFQRQGKPVRQLAGDVDLSFTLINKLSPKQLEQAQISKHHIHTLISGPKATDVTPKKVGLCAADFNQEQKDIFIKLVLERVGILNETHTEIAMNKIKQQLDQTYFAWYGDTRKESPATYQIQGPSIIIEYSPQRNSSNPKDHIHAMYRDPSNDYGAAFSK